jgi:hypothetical protein
MVSDPIPSRADLGFLGKTAWSIYITAHRCTLCYNSRTTQPRCASIGGARDVRPLPECGADALGWCPISAEGIPDA